MRFGKIYFMDYGNETYARVIITYHEHLRQRIAFPLNRNLNNDIFLLFNRKFRWWCMMAYREGFHFHQSWGYEGESKSKLLYPPSCCSRKIKWKEKWISKFNRRGGNMENPLKTTNFLLIRIDSKAGELEGGNYCLASNYAPPSYERIK